MPDTPHQDETVRFCTVCEDRQFVADDCKGWIVYPSGDTICPECVEGGFDCGALNVEDAPYVR